MELPLINRNCPLCGVGHPSRVFAEADFFVSPDGTLTSASGNLPEDLHFRLMECGQCDLVYASPAPSPEALLRIYQSADFDRGEESRQAARSYARALRSFMHRLPDLQGALDVGAGDGAFLEELLAAGFSDVVGVEASAAPIASAAPSIRPLMEQGVLASGWYAPNRFSLVTCLQTLEHVPDPLALTRAALDVLKPGGALFLVAHNRRALSAQLMGRASPIFGGEHMQLFSPRSLQRMLELAGFGGATVSPLTNRYPVHYWARLAPLPGSIKERLLPRLRERTLGRVMIPLRAGNIMAVGFKPR